jgi:hypothetical protein
MYILVLGTGMVIWSEKCGDWDKEEKHITFYWQLAVYLEPFTV